MAIHPPKDFDGWSQTKQRAWKEHWGQQNDIGKVDVDAAVPVSKNNVLDVHHAPEPKKPPATSPCDESAPSGTERTRRGEARAQKMRNAEQKKVEQKLADEQKRDEVLQKSRLDRAKANAKG